MLLENKTIIQLKSIFVLRSAIFLFVLIFLSYFHCTGLIRPNLYSNPEIVDSLEKDTSFLLSDGSFFTDVDSSMFSDKLKTYQKKTDESSQNLYALYCVRNSLSEDAENIWKILFDKSKNTIYLLNFIRLKYLVEDYEGLRIYLRNIVSKSLLEKEKLTQISSSLRQYNRLEENTLYLGVLSEFSVFESTANLELGDYFLNSGDLTSAKYTYEKILNSYSFDKKALDSLLKIAILEENYHNASVYGKVLRKEKYQNLEYSLNLTRAYYEIEEYSELLSFLDEIPENHKKDKQILTYWRNSLLSQDPFKSTQDIKKFLLKTSKENRAIEIEFSVSDDGTEIYKRIFHGF